MTLVDRLEAAGFIQETYEGAIQITDFEDSCIGYSDDGHLVYSYERMVEQIMTEEGCTREDAADYLDYNIMHSYRGTGARHPIIMHEI